MVILSTIQVWQIKENMRIFAVDMKRIFIFAILAALLGACAQKKNQERMANEQLTLAQEWDKAFPQSDKVRHEKVTFKTQYGFTLAFDPSFTGESSGEPRRTASPDINTEDFMAAIDYLSVREDVDADRIGIIGICGWGGIALNTAAIDPRVKATAVMTMYDMSRVNGNGYFDADNNEQARFAARKAS